ncbi:MAG TPA: tRNA epoxyqueuosine(34) reductase QueG [Rhodocyclaceae bacterium]|nr:tRNA epoxyqueuosine(34) reductase QueG [Rhodocyclaceae bacterium]
MHEPEIPDWSGLTARIKAWGRELGFAAVAVAPAGLPGAEEGLAAWLAAGCHGEMDYMAAHGARRARPAELLPGTRAVIAARMDYRPAGADPRANLADPRRAYVSRYALGRDYHKVLRNRLQCLAGRIADDPDVIAFGGVAQRVFTDSAPVMEVELAARAGLGWRGKHTLLLSREGGSWFFLGEIYTSLPLPPDPPEADHCGDCRACLDACPTGAIVAPYRVDARRCISYLTIELKGSIPEDLRPLVGNRVYGCDDCQLCCPWNRFAPLTREEDFAVRHGLDTATLAELFAWSEVEFEAKLAGSAIRRIGHLRWLRNLAVGLGNAPRDPTVSGALERRRDHPDAVVREHVRWALARQSAPDA